MGLWTGPYTGELRSKYSWSSNVLTHQASQTHSYLSNFSVASSSWSGNPAFACCACTLSWSRDSCCWSLMRYHCHLHTFSWCPSLTSLRCSTCPSTQAVFFGSFSALCHKIMTYRSRPWNAPRLWNSLASFSTPQWTDQVFQLGALLNFAWATSVFGGSSPALGGSGSCRGRRRSRSRKRPLNQLQPS